GGRRRDPPIRTTPIRTTPESEPPDPTWLYENEPPPAARPERPRPEAWRVAPSREKPRDAEQAEAPPEMQREPEDDPEAREGRRRRRLIVAAIGGALLLVAAICFAWYWFAELRWL